MKRIIWRNSFKKDLKTVKNYPNFNNEKFKQYVNDLANNKKLPNKAKDHKLSKSSPKEYKGLRDFQLAPDICVLYSINDDEIILYRIGKHNILGLTENINLSCIIN